MELKLNDRCGNIHGKFILLIAPLMELKLIKVLFLL